MLRKLLKHELIATGRMMWVIYVAMAALSVAANLSMRVMSLSIADFLLVRILLTLVLVAWGFSLVLGVLATLVLMVRRFYSNLLTDQGYLMFTLPTTPHQLVLSKLIVAALWLLLSIFMVVLCLVIAFLSGGFLQEAGEILGGIFQTLTARYALNGVAIVLELLILAFVASAANILQFYSAMSLGYGFTNHKALWSVVMYFLQSFALRVISTVLLVTPLNALSLPDGGFPLTTMQSVHLTMLSLLGLELVFCAIFYILTVVNLQKRLNLE